MQAKHIPVLDKVAVIEQRFGDHSVTFDHITRRGHNITIGAGTNRQAWHV